MDNDRIDRLYIYSKLMNSENHIFKIVESILNNNKINEDKTFNNIENIKQEMIRDIIILQEYQEYIKKKYNLQ